MALDPRPNKQFELWVKKTKVKEAFPGGNGRDFVPYSALICYWTPARIREALEAYPKPIPVQYTCIQSHYLRIFSTLVYANRVQDLQTFTHESLTDEKAMPLYFPPAQWGDGQTYKDLFDQVFKYQWIFFPQHLQSSTLMEGVIKEEVILPIIKCEYIVDPKDSVGSTVYKIEVEKSCHSFKLQDSKTATPNTFVLKVYNTDDIDQARQYRNELDAHNVLLQQNKKFSNVIQYLGAYSRSDSITGLNTSNIILEYADMGNLDEYFHRTEQPKSIQDKILFWKSMLKIFKGISKIHNISSGQFVIHGDLKPENILVSRKKDSKSIYDFEPKIADFGIASTQCRSLDGTDLGRNKDGDKLYSAPEANRAHPYNAGRMNITQAADIFSLGCVMLEACAWFLDGPPGLTALFNERQIEGRNHPDFVAGGYGGCFYSSQDILHCVRKRINSMASGHDCLVKVIAKNFLEKMLRYNPKDRFPIQLLINAIPAFYDLESLKCPVSHDRPGNQISSPLLPITPLELSIDQVLDYSRAPQNNPYNHGNIVRRKIDMLRKRLGNRDQIFFIDTSSSMEKHRKEVERVFEALAFIAAKIDGNELELCYIDACLKIIKHRQPIELLRQLRDLEYLPCHLPMIERDLSKVMEEVRQRLPSPEKQLANGFFEQFLKYIKRDCTREMNLFVFTDGNWGSGDSEDTGAQEPIRKLVNLMKAYGVDRNHVAIQFIRFGDHPDGKRHLEFLDSYGENLANCVKPYTPWDLVDTEPYNGDVIKMFIGSLSPEWDQKQTVVQALEDPLRNESTTSIESYWTCKSSFSRNNSIPLSM